MSEELQFLQRRFADSQPQTRGAQHDCIRKMRVRRARGQPPHHRQGCRPDAGGHSALQRRNCVYATRLMKREDIMPLSQSQKDRPCGTLTRGLHKSDSRHSAVAAGWEGRRPAPRRRDSGLQAAAVRPAQGGSDGERCASRAGRVRRRGLAEASRQGG